MSTLPTLIATSVVRGSQQGDSHGGVYLIDFQNKKVNQMLDWNTGDIDFQGRGWDRGLRGIEFDGDDIYFAASDELFVYGPDFKRRGSYRNSYLKHAHEIFRFGRNLYITSTGFNSVLAFDLDRKRFTWGIHVSGHAGNFKAQPFDPLRVDGPARVNLHHLNNVYCDDSGMYLSGRGTSALLKFDGNTLAAIVRLPDGVHNARPFGGGLLYNDTENNRVRHISSDGETTFKVPRFEASKLTNANIDGTRLARQAFGRGLCVIDDNRIAAGSSPSTIAIYDLDKSTRGKQVTLTMDVRNAIHGLEIWPF